MMLAAPAAGENSRVTDDDINLPATDSGFQGRVVDMLSSGLESVATDLLQLIFGLFVNAIPFASAMPFGILAAGDGGEAVNQGFHLMEFLRWSFDFLLHLDDELKKIVTQYGVWSHLILFGVIFCETGLVVTPFLPGDSLLFAAGAFAADRSLRIEWLLPLLIVAAIAGDTVNYWMGHWFGEHAFSGKIPFLKKDHLEKTHRFFEKYGGKTIILARFVPIIRTFAPFVAGMGSMNYRLFLVYNVVGGILWVLIFVPLG